MKRIVFTVTNDLTYDQRMIRICGSLANAGFKVSLIGAEKANSSPISVKSYQQIRLFSFFKKGFSFYAEYNIRLFFKLLFVKTDIICCIDLDTMLPVWMAGKLKRTKLVYDAHEYFTQQKEVISRPMVHLVWIWVEKTFVPKFKLGYTVSQSIAEVFKERYGVDYAVIRNLPVVKPLLTQEFPTEKILIYQGAVNEARGLEYLIPAMEFINARSFIYGDGNFMAQTKSLILKNNLSEKVILKGKVLPEDLDAITQEAYIGINLVENTGLNQYYSLANKFFDYIQNGIPQISMNFPEYRRINQAFEVAILLDDLLPENIATSINGLLEDEMKYRQLQQNCLKARQVLNWQHEEKILIDFYKNIN